jgi:amino acid-DNA transferase-like protein
MAEPQPDVDWRLPEHRREAFLRFYQWSVRYQSFPGGVHYVLPYIAHTLELDLEQRYWLAWLNANTQNPVTSLLLLRAAPRLRDYEAAISLWRSNYRALDWDTDRRYHKARFEDAVRGYAAAVDCGCALPQHRYFRVGYEWQAWWDAAYALPTMGRLSTWSYLEYLRILLGPSVVPDADTLMLEDIQGSRSHRNGLALLMGADEWIVDKQLGHPSVTDDIYKDPVRMNLLGRWAAELFAEVRRRCGAGADLLSLESALCTYKSWHKPNRRYPGVYNDMLYNRIITAENRWGRRFGILWQARSAALPPHLRLEDRPCDPGLSPVKQNWYLSHGQVIALGHDWPDMRDDFETMVRKQEFGRRARAWI